MKESFSELSEEIDFAQFAPYKVEAVTHNEGIYAVPFDSGSAGLYYRTDYLAEAGYTEEDMQNLTWSKFVDIGKDVKEKTGKWFVAFIPNRGTHYIQMAMQSAGVWYSATINSAEDQAGKWAYTNLPLLETVENATPYSNLGGSSWFVLEDSPNKDLAIEFLKTEFAGNDEFYQDILVENGAVGTYIPSQTGEAYQYKDPYFNDAQIYKDFSSWAEEIPGVDYGVNTSVAYEALRSVLQDYFDDKLTLDEILEQAEEYYTMQIGE
ncbi:extracellular solute-binding protein [Carnobacterium inhibens]|uniref:extracellular solute-binding protein n=1 Tax=Carnobacterium inhibens TaxID=147709 RepID=UPI000408A968|nr:extracellular solute-binding protein [Carnobacterium inhibens]